MISACVLVIDLLTGHFDVDVDVDAIEPTPTKWVVVGIVGIVGTCLPLAALAGWREPGRSSGGACA